MAPMRPRLAVAGALALLIAAGGAVAGRELWRRAHQIHHANVLGSSTREFDPTPTQPAPATTAAGPVEVPWTSYGFDEARTHVVPATLRPPYRTLWKRGVGIIEFPPSIVGGVLYLQLQRGPLYALDATTGDIRWKVDYKRCAAAQPAVLDGVVYAAYMHPGCVKHADNVQGFMVALDAATGKELWRFTAGVIESSPLIHDGVAYVGSWDQKVYAIDLARHTARWSFDTGSRISSSAAYAGGAIFIGTDDGQVYALDAATGKLRWSTNSFGSAIGGREYFYATPAVAYGRVYIGNTDGYVYAYGARSGHLLWATQAGTYVYTAAAVFNRAVYVGTWDGNVVALDAATGAIRWQTPVDGSIHGAPTISKGRSVPLPTLRFVVSRSPTPG